MSKKFVQRYKKNVVFVEDNPYFCENFSEKEHL